MTPQGQQIFAPDEALKHVPFNFTGQWTPDLHPLKTSNGDYADCQNIRYTKNGIVPINAYTKINATAISAKPKGRVGFQLRTPHTQKSYIFTQQWDTGLAASAVYQNKGTPPNTANFESAVLHVDATGALQATFAEAPNNDMVYCNGVETLVYGGEETTISQFVLASSITGLSVVNPIIFTEQIRNLLTDAKNIVTVAAASHVYLVGSTRPIDTIIPYIHTANDTPSTVNVKEWLGSAWSDCTITLDETIVDGKTHAKTGKINLTSTVTTSKPSFIVDTLLYWYLVTISDGTCVLYHATVGAPMQELVNIWDGVNRTCIQCEINRTNLYEDFTAEVYEASSVQYPIAANFAGLASTDHVILMFEERTTAIKFAFLAGLINTTASALTVYYHNGTTWVTVGTVYDGTQNSSGTIAMNQNGTIYWDAPDESLEHKINLFSTLGYAYKLEWSGGLAAHASRDIQGLSKANPCAVTWICHQLYTGDLVTFSAITQANWTALNGVTYTVTVKDDDHFTLAVSGTGLDTTGYAAVYDATTDPGKISVVSADRDDGCRPDTIYGIPAVKKMGTYRFAFNYKNRIFLAGDVVGKEGHGIDYSIKDAADVFNGKDSSAEGNRLYIGKNSSDVMAAVNVFNRFGASIYNSELILKNNETHLLDGDDPTTFKVSQISENIGLGAVRTLCTAEVAFEVTKDAIRNIAMWISGTGPVLFDAAVLVPLGGINLYFDPNNAACVNFSVLNDVAHSCFDPMYYTWHVFLPSGIGQTTCNVWLTYDLINKKWAKRGVGSQYVPQATIKVIDDSGTAYFYGLLDTGHMVRLEHGNLWNGVEPIEMFVTTNMLMPTGDMFDVTILRHLKIFFENNGASDVTYTRTDCQVLCQGLGTGDLHVYGEVIEDPSCSEAYWEGDNFICKELIEGATLSGGLLWQDVSGVVSITGATIEGWLLKITTTAGDFVAAGFAAGSLVTTDNAGNIGPYLCVSLTATEMFFRPRGLGIERLTVASLTLTTTHIDVEIYKDGSATPIIPNIVNIESNDTFIKVLLGCALTGQCFQFKFSLYSNATEQNSIPIAWAPRFISEREDING